MVLGLAAGAFADDQIPVHITSDKMTYSDKGRSVTFEGRVKIVRGDLTITSHQLVANFIKAKEDAEDFSGQAERIKEIVASGNVRLDFQGRKGSCGRMVYDVDNGILRMEQHPKLVESRNIVEGEVIKFYLKDYRSEVLGGKNKRVEAIFFAPDEFGAGKDKP
jgi:lipopolysaccharide transport protein LptA